MFLYVIALLASLDLVAGNKIEAFQCSNNQLQQCLIIITLERSRNDIGMSLMDFIRHCRTTRENMNCVIKYSSDCLSQSQRHLTKDIIESTRDYLSNMCEDYDQVDENWLDETCYLNKDMERCKDDFLKQHDNYRAINDNSCSRYLTFQDCAQKILETKCKPEEHELYLKTYLLDKAGQLAWMCSHQDRYFNGRDDQSVQRSLKGAICLTEVRHKLSECRKDYDIRKQNTEVSDSFAAACCSFNEYATCIRVVVADKCGFEGRDLSEAGLRRLNAALGGMCDVYDSGRCSSVSKIAPFASIIAILIIFAQINIYNLK